MTVADALKGRISANFFDPKAQIRDEEIRQMVALASEAPSSFNTQNWRVIAVTDKAVRAELRKAAWDQAKVTDSAVLFAVLGNTQVAEKITTTMGLARSKGVVDEKTAEWFQQGAKNFYEGKATISRDEAIRSASYLAMSLMLVAQEKGYGTGPMIGFDPAAVAKILKVPDHWVVTVLIACGPLAPSGNWKRKPRLDDVLAFNSF